METLHLEVERRQGRGKGPARRLRASGRVPGVFYGPKSATLGVAFDAKEFSQRISQIEGTHLIQLRSQDPELDKRTVLLRDVQSHPVSGALIHADLYEVALDRAIEVKVPLHLSGKPVGVTLGGILQPLHRDLMVRCLPTNIPEAITVDVSELAIHDSIHVGELTLPEGVEAVLDASEAVVTVLPPTVEEKPAEAAPEEVVEGAEVAAPVVAEPEEGKK